MPKLADKNFWIYCRKGKSTFETKLIACQKTAEVSLNQRTGLPAHFVALKSINAYTKTHMWCICMHVKSLRRIKRQISAVMLTAFQSQKPHTCTTNQMNTCATPHTRTRILVDTFIDFRRKGGNFANTCIEFVNITKWVNFCDLH